MEQTIEYNERLNAFNRREDLRARFKAIVSAVETNLEKRRELDVKKDNRLELQKSIETKIRSLVSDELTPDGKKKYTNQEQRDTAVYLATQSDDSFKNLSAELFSVISELTKVTDTLELLKIKLRAAEAEVSLESMEKI